MPEFMPKNKVRIHDSKGSTRLPSTYTVRCTISRRVGGEPMNQTSASFSIKLRIDAETGVAAIKDSGVMDRIREILEEADRLGDADGAELTFM